MKRIDLIAIDFQNSFLEGGSLAVTGGKQAAVNTAKLIDRLDKKITNIHASLDSHQSIQCFHPKYWLDKNNQNPPPFTIITHQDVVDGKWKTSKKAFQLTAEKYLKELEAKGKYSCCCWPEHCLVGTQGWLIEETLMNSLLRWESDNIRRVNYIAKGNSVHTEAYSAFESEIPDPSDPSTQLNMQLVQSLEEADTLVWTGLALSHCLKFSFQTIVDNFSNVEYIKKCVLLRDCTESVGGFEQQGEDFIKDIVAKGATVMNSVDFLK